MIYSVSTARFKFAIVFSMFLLISNSSVFAQSPKDFKNSIKFNVTNMLLYDNSYQFSYERIISKNQSANVFFGYQEFPLITADLGDNNVNLKKDSKRSGYSYGADYRFYLGNINKYSAPRGVYLAPFVSFFQFDTDRKITYTNPDNNAISDASLNTKINLTNFGGELGYQFVLWDHFVIDCVLFGPSLTHYKYNVKVDGDTPGLDENDLAQKVIEALKDKFPNIANVTGDEGISKKGVQSLTAVGFRYNISIGYRF